MDIQQTVNPAYSILRVVKSCFLWSFEKNVFIPVLYLVRDGFELQTSHNLFCFLRAHTQACTHTSSPLHTQLLEHLCACLKYICFQAYYLLKDAAPLKV